MGYIYDVLSLGLLIAGIISMVVGKKKNDPKLRGIGIGIVTAVLIIVLPDIAKGFMEGVLSAGDSAFPMR